MAALHQVYSALGDAARLKIVERLSEQGEMTTLELVEGLGMSRQAATKHLIVLENVGLVESRARGRQVMRRLNPNSLKPANAWLEERAEMWERRLSALAAFVESMEEVPDAGEDHRDA